MSIRSLGSGSAWWALSCSALAGTGLVAPDPSSLWPLWQARIAVQTATVSPLSLIHPLDGAASPRALHGGAVLGDYNFATPAFGIFRASGGLMVGGLGGAPLAAVSAGPRLGLTLQTSGPYTGAAADAPGAVPYLGLGFSGAAWRQTLSITADLGWVAERPGAAGHLGRAIFGNQGMDTAVRDLRLSPVLQLGMRYTF